MNEYVVLDLEMTGLNPVKDKIIEIGAVKIKKGQVEESFERLIFQKGPLSPKITEITGITEEMLQTGVNEDNAMKELLIFLEDLPLVGHHIIFDYGFVKQWAVNHKIPFQINGVDTLKLARILMPQLEKKSLDYLCEILQIKRNRSHRALDDAMATYQLFRLLQTKDKEQHLTLFEPKELKLSVKRQTPATNQQKKYLLRLAQYHKITLDLALDELTRSEASRETDRIICTYGRMDQSFCESEAANVSSQSEIV